MRLPDFLIIGAAKSGTTTLYEYLCKHPQIFMSTPKEPDFFSVEANYELGLDWYTSLFAAAEPNQICGEASTTYSRCQQHPNAAERIARTLPNVKLIYIMRHPIDRAYSFYVHRLKGSRYKPELAVGKTFEETIQQQSEFVDSSYYLQQIECYLKFFPKESFLFLLMDDLIQNPETTIEQTFEFIGVDPHYDLGRSTPIVANKASDNPEWFVRQQLTAPLQAIPGVQQIKSMIPKDLRDRVYQVLKQWKYKSWADTQYRPPAMLPETRQTLSDRFRQPNQQLSEFLDRDLSHWNQ